MNNSTNHRQRTACLIITLIVTAACLLLVCICAAYRMVSFAAANGYCNEETEFVVASYNEKIAVFENGSIEPIEIFDVYVNSLPPEDIKAVNSGIHAYGSEELNRLIEDYTS